MLLGVSVSLVNVETSVGVVVGGVVVGGVVSGISAGKKTLLSTLLHP